MPSCLAYYGKGKPNTEEDDETNFSWSMHLRHEKVSDVGVSHCDFKSQRWPAFHILRVQTTRIIHALFRLPG